jgi:hypothetical protein
MSERKLDQLTNLRHLFPATTNIIVSNLIQITLFVFSLNGLSFAMDDRVLCNNTKLWRVHLDDLELYLSHSTTACEGIALSDGSVGFAEVRGEEHVKEVAGKAFDGVRDGEDGNALGLKNFSAKNL